MYRLLKKYFTITELRDYCNNTRVNTISGNIIEELTKELLISEGYTLLYEGTHGDFIDMRYGIDFIMEKDDVIYLIQVKSNLNLARSSISKPEYQYVDIFVGETYDKNGIVLFEKDKYFQDRIIQKEMIKNNMEYLLKRFY